MSFEFQLSLFLSFFLSYFLFFLTFFSFSSFLLFFLTLLSYFSFLLFFLSFLSFLSYSFPSFTFTFIHSSFLTLLWNISWLPSSAFSSPLISTSIFQFTSSFPFHFLILFHWDFYLISLLFLFYFSFISPHFIWLQHNYSFLLPLYLPQ